MNLTGTQLLLMLSIGAAVGCAGAWLKSQELTLLAAAIIGQVGGAMQARSPESRTRSGDPPAIERRGVRPPAMPGGAP